MTRSKPCRADEKRHAHHGADLSDASIDEHIGQHDLPTSPREHALLRGRETQLVSAAVKYARSSGAQAQESVSKTSFLQHFRNHPVPGLT